MVHVKEVSCDLVDGVGGGLPSAHAGFPVADSAVRFEGPSYLKFLHRLDEDQQNFSLALTFNTFQERGLLAATAGGEDWGRLEVRGAADDP